MTKSVLPRYHTTWTASGTARRACQSKAEPARTPERRGNPKSCLQYYRESVIATSSGNFYLHECFINHELDSASSQMHMLLFPVVPRSFNPAIWHPGPAVQQEEWKHPAPTFYNPAATGNELTSAQPQLKAVGQSGSACQICNTASNILSREAVAALWLQVSKPSLDGALRNLI